MNVFFSQLCAQDLFFPQSHGAILSSPASRQCHQRSTTSNYSLEFRGVLGARSRSKQWHSVRAEKENWLQTHKVCSVCVAWKNIRSEKKKDSVLLLYWCNLAWSAGASRKNIWFNLMEFSGLSLAVNWPKPQHHDTFFSQNGYISKFSNVAKVSWKHFFSQLSLVYANDGDSIATFKNYMPRQRIAKWTLRTVIGSLRTLFWLQSFVRATAKN